MSRVVCEIALAEGRWNYSPSAMRLRRMLRRLFGRRFLAATFHAPGDDNRVEAEIEVVGNEDDCDEIRGAIFLAFLGWMPEFESMIDVSVAVD